MAEEKKEEKKTDQAAVPTPAPESAQVAAPEAAKAPAEKKAAPKKEKPANCSGCNKSIKKKRWYYRDGKFFCTKRCWRTALKKDAKPQDTQAEGAAGQA